MREPHFIVQKTLTRGLDPRAAAETQGGRVSFLEDQIDLAHLRALESEVQAAGERPIVFCSLQVAGRILRLFPGLAPGVALPRDFLRHHVYTSCLDQDLLLNPDGLYLPWGRIAGQRDFLAAHFPQGVFLRPDSPMKPFAGFATGHADLGFEISARSQTDRVDPAELVYIAPRLDLPEIEYRFWIVDSHPCTAAPYSWLETARPPRRIPAEAFEAARAVAQALALREQIFTVDIVMLDGVARVVEINALSTSGWYPGLSLDALFQACNATFI